jgi:hypothetical protein
MNFLKKLKDKIHELRQETEKWPEQARAQVAENMIKSEQSLMKARYEFMNSRLQTKNLPLYKSMDIFLEQFEEKQKEYLLIKEEFIKKNSVHDKFHRTLILSGFCLLKIAKISLNSSFSQNQLNAELV